MFPYKRSLCAASAPPRVWDGNGRGKASIRGHLVPHYRGFFVRFSKQVQFVVVCEFGEDAVGYFSVVVAIASMNNQVWHTEPPAVDVKRGDLIVEEDPIVAKLGAVDMVESGLNSLSGGYYTGQRIMSLIRRWRITSCTHVEMLTFRYQSFI